MRLAVIYEYRYIGYFLAVLEVEMGTCSYPYVWECLLDLRIGLLNP